MGNERRGDRWPATSPRGHLGFAQPYEGRCVRRHDPDGTRACASPTRSFDVLATSREGYLFGCLDLLAALPLRCLVVSSGGGSLFRQAAPLAG